jgi:hypothetical protein
MNRPDMIPADPDYRKKVLKKLVVIALAGIVLFVFATQLVERQMNQPSPEDAIRTIKLLLAFLLVLPLAIASYFIVMGIRTLRYGQFPPEGTKVLRDTPIMYDNAAKKRGILLLILSGLIVNFGILALVFFLRFLKALV